MLKESNLDLKSIGWDKKASSLRVGPNTIVTFCKLANCTGGHTFSVVGPYNTGTLTLTNKWISGIKIAFYDDFNAPRVQFFNQPTLDGDMSGSFPVGEFNQTQMVEIPPAKASSM